jgi:hypothetical protein
MDAKTFLLILISWLPVAFLAIVYLYGLEEHAYKYSKYVLAYLIGVNVVMVIG